MWRLYAGFISRIFLGVMWLIAGVPKVIHHQAAMTSIYQYNIVPHNFVPILALLQPMMEIILGIFFLVGILIRWVSLASIVLLLIYIAGIVSLGVRNMKVDCGCFSIGSYDPHAGWNTYGWDIARDGGFIILAILASIYVISWSHFVQALTHRKQYGNNQLDHTRILDTRSMIDLPALGLTEAIMVRDKPTHSIR